jgi:hypothetical protein
MWQNKIKLNHKGVNYWFLQTDENNNVALICFSEPLLIANIDYVNLAKVDVSQ